jgi:hypothetical protein
MSARPRAVAVRFATRRRRRLWATLRYTGWLLLAGLLILVCTVGPMWLLWWNTAVPAAIGTAIFALILFAVVMRLPFEAFAYVSLVFERDLTSVPFPGFRFGRGLYRESGRLDALADAAGLPLLSSFESPDVLDTGQPPVWHRPADALPTVEHLLGHIDPSERVHQELQHLRTALAAARDGGVRFYMLVLTWGDFTNADIYARRRGELTA